MIDNDLHKREGYSIYKQCLVWAGDTFLEKKLTKKCALELISKNCAWMIRNCYNWDCGYETNFWEIICDKTTPIELLPSKTRNQIRRSLRDCNIQKITIKQLVKDNAYDVFIKAFSRYKDVTEKLPSRYTWESSLNNEDNADYWGVYEKESGKLIAWARCTVKSKSVSYNTLKAIPEMMNKHYPYFGLLYIMNSYYLDERGLNYVSDGWRSITEHSGIQPFLEKNFLFRKAYCHMSIYYTLWLKIAIKLLFPFRKTNFLPLSIRNVLKLEAIARNLW